MHIEYDDGNNFMGCFKGVQQEYQIQFLQLANDDRTILPRVVKDLDRNQFMFQLFDYRE